MKSILITLAFIAICCIAKSQKIDTLKGLRADTLIFTAVQKPPSFPGGDKAFNKFLAKNLKYPEPEAQGKIFIQFIVEKDGSPSRFKIVKGISPLDDNEALRVLKLSPKWNPGMQNGHKVRVYRTVPINFYVVD